MGTSGRADYVAIEEDTGALHAWANECSQVSGTRTVKTNGGGCGTAPLPSKTTAEPPPNPSVSTAWTHLDGFTGCGTGPGSDKQVILDTWETFLKMSQLVCNRDSSGNCVVDWNEDVTIDFIGPPDLVNAREMQNLLSQYTP